jgi:hypothetical protein
MVPRLCGPGGRYIEFGCTERERKSARVRERERVCVRASERASEKERVCERESDREKRDY